MTDAPPSRWQVVERDRRLVVIDRASGQELGPRRAPAVASDTAPGRVEFGGGAVVTTHSFYDDKAPRTISLDAASLQSLRTLRTLAVLALFALVVLAVLWPVSLALLLVLFQRGFWKSLRRRATDWLDARDGG